jgi:HAD superfamily hydrolase (TIGR01509 family)
MVQMARGTAMARGEIGGAFQAVIFDCDGLLVDSSAAWADAFDHGAATVNLSLTSEQHRMLLGSSTETAATRISDWAARADQAGSVRAEIHDALRAATRRHPPRPQAGVADLLGTLHGRLPLAVASNAPPDVLAGELDASGLRAAFTAVVSADSVQHPKPAPDVYLAACAALGVDASSAVALEDSADGAIAAQRARLSLIVVTDHAWPQQSPLAWPAQRRSILYVTTLADPSVQAHLLGVSGKVPTR